MTTGRHPRPFLCLVTLVQSQYYPISLASPTPTCTLMKHGGFVTTVPLVLELPGSWPARINDPCSPGMHTHRTEPTALHHQLISSRFGNSAVVFSTSPSAIVLVLVVQDQHQSVRTYFVVYFVPVRLSQCTVIFRFQLPSI